MNFYPAKSQKHNEVWPNTYKKYILQIVFTEPCSLLGTHHFFMFSMSF